MRARRVLAGLAIGLLVAGGLGVVGALGFGLWLRTPEGNVWLARRLEAAASGAMTGGTLTIGRLSTDLWSRVELESVELRDGSGALLVDLPRARARVDLDGLVTGRLRVRELAAAGLALDLSTGPDGRMKLASVFGPPSTSTEPFELPVDLVVDRFSLEGISVGMDRSLAASGGVAVGRLTASGAVFELPELVACAHLVVPGPTSVCAEGPVRWDGARVELPGTAVEAPGAELAVSGSAGAEGVALEVAVGGLDLVALDALASHAGIAGTWGGALTVSGTPEALEIDGRLAGTGASRGALIVDGWVRTGPSIRWGGAIDALGLHVEDAYPAAGGEVVLDGRIGLDATGVSFPSDLDLGLTYAGSARVFGEYQADELDVRGRLTGGVLTLERTAFLGIAGRLDATGTVDLAAGPVDLRVRGQVIPAEIAELGIEGLGGAGTADLTVRGDLKGAPGAFRVAGRVVMAPFAYTEDVAFERLVVDLDGSTRGPDFAFRVDATGEQGRAYGLSTATLTATDVDVRSTAGELAAVGGARLEPVSHPDLGVFADAVASFDVALPPGGPQRAEATVALGSFDLRTFLGTGGAAVVAVEGDAARFTVALDDGDRPFLRTSGRYDLASGRLEADDLSVAPTPRLAWRAPGALALTVVAGGVADADVALEGLHGDVRVQGDLATEGALDGRIALKDVQLDALAELFPDAFGGLSGVLTADVAVGGDARAASLRGSADLTGLWVDGVTRWLDVKGTFDAQDGVVTTDLDVGSAGAPLAAIAGRFPAFLDLAAPGPDPAGEVRATVALRPGPLARLDHVTVSPLGLPEGDLSALLELDGRLGDPRIRLAGVLRTPVAGWSEPGRVEFDLRRDGAAIEAWASAAEGLAERVRVGGGGSTRMGEAFAWALEGGPEPALGDLTLWLDDMAVSAVLAGMPVDSAVRASGLALDARGQLAGSVTAYGSPYEPRMEGALDWLQASIAGVALEEAHLTVSPGDSGLLVDLGAAFGEGRLAVTGEVPVAIDLREEVSTWADGPLALTVEGTGVPLGLVSLVDAGVTDATGRMSVAGSIGGTLADPVPDLVARGEDGALTYGPVGLRITNATAEIEARGRRLRYALSGETAPVSRIGLVDQGRSAVAVTGAANLEGVLPTELSARVELDGAWVMGTHDIGMRLDGDLLVSGAWPGLQVRSQEDLVVLQGRVSYDSDEALAAGMLQPVPELAIHRGAVASRSTSTPSPPFYAGFDVDVGVDLNRSLELYALVAFFDELGAVTSKLTRGSASARVGGRVRVALDDAGDPLLGGEVDVLDGSVQLLRTSFKLEPGRLVFLGDDIEQTQLDLAASASVQGTPVEMRISGTAGAPRLITSSPGYDETQVLLMLLTGRPPESVAGEQGRAAQSQMEALASTAAALVASSVLSGTSSGALTIEPDGAVKVGAPWSATVYTQFLVRPFAGNEENRFSGSLDWTLAPRLVLELGAGDRYQWSDLSWEVRF